MKVNVKEFLKDAGITEPFYPGKKLVHSLRQTGEYKSHCVVLDWRDPAKIRIEIKAGLSGKDLEPARLKYYPVCFQTPTYIDLEIVESNDNKDEDEEGKSKSSSSSGGKGLKKKGLESMKLMAADAFSSVMAGKVPELGNIVDMVVMGMQISKEAYGAVMEKLTHQISHAKITATDLLASAGKFVTRYMPPAFLKPTGDETATYKYDREKNADIGYRGPVIG